jgi:hypothetical protein
VGQIREKLHPSRDPDRAHEIASWESVSLFAMIFWIKLDWDSVFSGLFIAPAPTFTSLPRLGMTKCLVHTEVNTHVNSIVEIKWVNWMKFSLYQHGLSIFKSSRILTPIRSIHKERVSIGLGTTYLLKIKYAFPFSRYQPRIFISQLASAESYFHFKLTQGEKQLCSNFSVVKEFPDA